jgi:hypothetical protein
MENNGMQIETKMMLPVKTITYIRPWYNSANFAGPSKGTLHMQLIMLKQIRFFLY